MTEFEQKLLDEIADLKQSVARLQSEYSISQITYFENLAPAAIVGPDYVAYRFGCSETAVIRGRFETHRIPRVRKKPVAFTKREVDAVWQNLSRTASEKAAVYRHQLHQLRSSGDKK